ncbi:MAG: zinc-ribbon domain-containing protein [Candidatus Lokiarchaeota archaeon]|nr:zinc-ribbon domain-containing protein [Candidatus Lokiarchaeota archaeon]
MINMFWLSKRITTNNGEKLGVSSIEYIILAHLRRRELINEDKIGQYGKELIDDLNDMFRGSWEAQSGTIYPILSKLDRQKDYLIGVNKKTPLGPVKKVYTLTDKGRSLIDQIIRENYESDLEFLEQYQEMLKPFIDFFKEHPIEESEQTEGVNASEDADHIICSHCGTPADENAIYCSLCGSELHSNEDSNQSSID